MITIEETKECYVHTSDGEIIGIVQDILNNPEDFRTRYPENYRNLSKRALEREGIILDDNTEYFPMLLLDDEYTPRYVFKPMMDKFRFIRDPRSPTDILREKILNEDFARYGYMSHTTLKWRECLKDGVEPRTFDRFYELKTQKRYSMWCGNTNYEEDGLNSVGVQDDAGIIVARRTSGHLSLLNYLLENDMLSGRILYRFKVLSEWFISFDVIEPKDFIVIYSMTGEKLWER